MKYIIKTYTQIDSAIWNLFAAQICLQLINSAFFLILNLYMHKNNYSDANIANYMSWRYSAVVFFAVPFGMYIRNRPLLPIMWATTLLLPIVSFALLWSIERHWSFAIVLSTAVWGVVFSLSNIPIVPYILRNTHAHLQSQAIALSASVWSASQIAAGIIIAILSYIDPVLFSEKLLLQLFCGIGLLALYFLWKMDGQEAMPETTNTDKQTANQQHYDWKLITQISLPTLFIAVGAGMAIPFMNLFFYHIFGIDSAYFSIIGVITSIIVTISALFAPLLKQKWGFHAIIWTQLLSIICMATIAGSELIKNWQGAVYVAIIAYILRQPLMHLSNPLATEMSMQYVGSHNREITSAITSSIWAGSWFFSSQIFSWLRAANLPYSTIFSITILLYLFAIGVYFLLVKQFYQREQNAVTI